ncbi:hypothetical protein MBANPS3_007842 [Mucor bainieri]
MLASWDKLPVEALSIVFKAIPDVGQVARCRLVCKAWNPVAEKEMFSKKFDMYYDKTKFVKIIRHLSKKPSLGLLITHLHLTGFYHDPKDLVIIKKVLQLAFTPSIKVIGGYLFDEKELISYLYEIASKSKTKFSKLERLPFTSPTTELNAKFINLIRDSIKELDLTCSNENQPHQKMVLDHLDKFKSLTKLVLRYKKNIDSFVEMENILKKCPHLKLLVLEMDYQRCFSMPTDELKKWLVKNVKKNPSVTEFRLGRVAHSEVIEYLYYKFPKATNLKLRGTGKDPLQRLLPIAKDMANITIDEWGLDSMEEVKTVTTALKGQINSVSISNFMDHGNGLVSLNISRCKPKGTTRFDFGVFDRKDLLPDILSTVGDIVDFMDVDFLPLEEDDNDDQKVSPFYTVFTALPSIKKLKFTDISIKNQPLSIKNIVLQQLTEVEINGTMLKDDVLPTLSKIAPNLKRLTLGTCYFDTANLQHQKLFIPDSSLETMCIQDYSFGGFYDSGETVEQEDLSRWIREQMHVDDDGYMFIQVTESATPRKDRSFILKVTEPTTTCKLVSKKVFTANAGSWPRIQSLEIKLGAVKTTIDLRGNWKVQDVGDWNFTKKPDKYNLPRAYKRDSILVRMRKENAAMERYFERERKREHNLDRYGVSDSEDYEGSDYGDTDEDDYCYGKGRGRRVGGCHQS